jgi:uncharacterized protein YceK
MLKRTLFVLAAAATMVLMSGCTTLADARAAKGSGPSREYAASMDKVWNTIPVVLKELELPLVSQNRAEGTILAQRGVTAFSYGENVAIFVEPAGGATRTRVEIVSKKAMETNIFAPDWSVEILDKLGQKLR